MSDFLPIPYSPGEVVDLSGPTDGIASTLDRVRELEGELREFKRGLGVELTRRIDEAVRTGESQTYTARVGRFKLSVPSPKPGEEIDAPALRGALLDLARTEGAPITPGAVLRAFERIVKLKPRKRALNALAAQDPRIAELMRMHTTTTVVDRRVRVEIA